MIADPGAQAASRSVSSRSASKGGSASPKRRRRPPKQAVPKPAETPGTARIIAIANQKGGVGKSTTAVSLGAALADLGFRVLVVDLDPQGNASTGMGIRHEARESNVYHVVVAETPIDQAIVPTPVERLDAVPSTIDLAGAEIELVSQFSRETRLKRALEPLREGRYDFVLLDCPPSLGLLTVNALTAAEELIVPIQCEYYALEGLGQLLRNVSLVQQNINPELRLSGIVMTMFDPRTKLSEQVVEEVQRYFGELVYDVIIPRTVRLSEAPGFGQPITVYDPRSKGAQAYRQLATEVAGRPPPAEPMPVFDDLPTVVVQPVDDAVTHELPNEPVLEELPTPTVHQLVEEMEGQAEVEPKVETPPTPAPGLPGPPVVAEPNPPPQVQSAEPQDVVEPAELPPESNAKAAPVAFDDDDIWEAEDTMSPAIPPQADRAPVAQTQHAPTRRVVVIDENADRPVGASPEAAKRPLTPGDEPRPVVAGIGATLEEEGQRKRRWRLFRKGGE